MEPTSPRSPRRRAHVNRPLRRAIAEALEDRILFGFANAFIASPQNVTAGQVQLNFGTSGGIAHDWYIDWGDNTTSTIDNSVNQYQICTCCHTYATNTSG